MKAPTKKDLQRFWVVPNKMRNVFLLNTPLNRVQVGYNPEDNTIVYDSHKSTTISKEYWNIEKYSRWPISLYIFRKADGDLHIYRDGAITNGNYDIDTVVIEMFNDMEFLCHDVWFVNV